MLGIRLFSWLGKVIDSCHSDKEISHDIHQALKAINSPLIAWVDTQDRGKF